MDASGTLSINELMQLVVGGDKSRVFGEDVCEFLWAQVGGVEGAEGVGDVG